MKNIIYIISMLVLVGCTKDFTEYNTNPYGATDSELDRIPQGGSQLVALQKLVVPEQENSYQMCFDLLATPYAGYASQPKFRSDFPVYNPRAGWVQYPYTDTYPKIYKNFYELKKLAKGDESKQFYALGSILRVAITHYLTDSYGALPYSKMQEGADKVSYDSQQDLYLQMCEDIQKAVIALKKIDASDREYAPFDMVYAGDMTKWIKYANSLLLRLAVRMSGVAPDQARKYAQFAIDNGVIEQNSDNAQLTTSDNSVFKVSHTWGDSVTGADITEYMNAFSDPRREKFFTKVEGRSNPFFGMASTNENVNIEVQNYSKPNLTKGSPIVWISAAEVAFIKAELKLKNIITNGEDAKSLYEKGIQLSCEQWGVSVGSYLKNTSKRQNFTDEKASGFNANFSSQITVKWDDNASSTDEQKLAKIITQKWIAMYPYGAHEAWAEWRRTGYPNMLPVVTNKSGGIVSNVTQSDGKDVGGMRRIPYPQKEYNENRTHILEAVQLLGGADTGATDMWWVKK